MKRILFFLVISCWSTGIWSLNCGTYKVGRFILFDQKSNIHVRIERTATEQVETDLKTGKYIRFNIKWYNECEYELTVVEGNSEQVAFFRHRKLHFRVTDVYADGFRFEGKLQGSNTLISNILRVL